MYVIRVTYACPYDLLVLHHRNLAKSRKVVALARRARSHEVMVGSIVL